MLTLFKVDTDQLFLAGHGLCRKGDAIARRTLLTEDEIQARLGEIPPWKQEGKTISRTWKFRDFPEALPFTNKVGALSESMNHHPDIYNSRREKSAAKAAPPGHPVPFTQPMVFWMSFTLGQPCARKIAPSARRPTRPARSVQTGRAIPRPAPNTGVRGRKIFQTARLPRAIHRDRSRSSAMSYRRMSSRFFVFAASSSMIRQYGHAAATPFACVSSTWLSRRWLTFSPFSSSIHMRAPPAPQQNPRSRHFSISTTRTPGMR